MLDFPCLVLICLTVAVASSQASLITLLRQLWLLRDVTAVWCVFSSLPERMPSLSCCVSLEIQGALLFCRQAAQRDLPH